jgi:hypothetical protein
MAKMGGGQARDWPVPPVPARSSPPRQLPREVLFHAAQLADRFVHEPPVAEVCSRAARFTGLPITV